eukprot:4358421-Amphidinium_carterae.1
MCARVLVRRHLMKVLPVQSGQWLVAMLDYGVMFTDKGSASSNTKLPSPTSLAPVQLVQKVELLL